MRWSREMGCCVPLGPVPPFRICGKSLHADGPFCKEHGCAKCGNVILADSEDGPELLCIEHYEEAEKTRLQ